MDNSNPNDGSISSAAARGLISRVYRHELKYYLNHTDYTVLSNILRRTLQADSHGDSRNEYWIRSLYFDSTQNNDYYQKIMGAQIRKKIRLRIYDAAQRDVKLEIKNKHGQYMLKETAIINREEAEALIGGDRDVLLREPHPIREKAYYFMSLDYYHPVVIVDYEREAYICPVQNIRLTFDKRIRAGMADFNMFDRNITMTPVFDTDMMVLEVKYNRFFPDWLRNILANFDGIRDAIGKYCYGRWLY